MSLLDTKGQYCRGCGAADTVSAQASFSGQYANRSVRVHYHCATCNSVWDETFILSEITKVVDLDDIVVELDAQDPE